MLSAALFGFTAGCVEGAEQSGPVRADKDETASGGASAETGQSGGTAVGTAGRPGSGGVGGSANASGGTTSNTAGDSSTGGASGSNGTANGTSGAAGTANTGGGALNGTIYFSNDGLKAGWTSARPQGNTIGRIVEVTDPTYKTDTALLMEQTYVRPQGAHSEVILATAQKNGEDKYYGQSIYLPSDWNTVNENATFQQFSPEAPAGPWNLNWIQNDHIFIRVAGKHYDCGPIKKGEWTNVVVRFKTSDPGIFEYWVNGDKKWSVTDVNLTIPNGSPSMRWSVGLYVTWWRTEDPGPQTTRQIYHDQMRVTSTYELAEPANW